jgi:hypothetical protein
LLGAILQKAVDSGQLEIDDPVHAAHQFIGLCQNRMMKARLCNAMAEPTPEEIDRRGAAGRRCLPARVRDGTLTNRAP